MSRTYKTSRRRWNIQSATEKLIALCKDDGLEFAGFIGEFNGQSTEFNYICPIHGVHKATFKNFVNHGSRCPNCHGGYNTDFAGTFYIFKIEAEGKAPIFKFGVTNRNADIRGNEHIRGINAKSTKVCDMFFANGEIPLKIEKHVKKNFSDNSGVWLKTGYTETVAANDDVLDEIIKVALDIAA
ncbi:hypothetical protein ACK3Z8_00850 [Aeromonas caviae]